MKKSLEVTGENLTAPGAMLCSMIFKMSCQGHMSDFEDPDPREYSDIEENSTSDDAPI